MSDDEELVSVEIELPPDLVVEATKAADAAGVPVEDFLSLLIAKSVKGY